MWNESNDKKILELEKEIAYFFGVDQPESVAKHYLDAINLVDEKNQVPEVESQRLMLSHLMQAYAEVKKQTGYNFDIHKAATWELDLLIANLENAPFEVEYELLLKIYLEVFGMITHEIQNAALLRTFLYRYKNHLMSLPKSLSDADVDFLKLIARKSEVELENSTKYLANKPLHEFSTAQVSLPI